MRKTDIETWSLRNNRSEEQGTGWLRYFLQRWGLFMEPQTAPRLDIQSRVSGRMKNWERG